MHLYSKESVHNAHLIDSRRYVSRILIVQFSDEDYGDKYASVLIDGQETELEIIDRPASEMSVSEDDILYVVGKSRAGWKVEETRGNVSNGLITLNERVEAHREKFVWCLNDAKWNRVITTSSLSSFLYHCRQLSAERPVIVVVQYKPSYESMIVLYSLKKTNRRVKLIRAAVNNAEREKREKVMNYLCGFIKTNRGKIFM